MSYLKTVIGIIIQILFALALRKSINLMPHNHLIYKVSQYVISFLQLFKHS